MAKVDSTQLPYYTETAAKIRKSVCYKAEDGKHVWVERGESEVSWQECKHCRSTLYHK